MSSIWMGVAPGPREMRVLAMAGPRETILKARLLRPPTHPRALPLLLEALALWQGQSVRVALAAEERGVEADLSAYDGIRADDGGAAPYTVEWVPPPGRVRRRHRDLSGVDDFCDLRQLLLFGVP
ncbi:MAG: hypothetical protein IPI67_07735 [Myxococcales bacterium]|nr:hypothetical protein [Myxococcales bacterium]